MSTTVVNNTVCVQQHKKQDHKYDIILSELQIQLKDIIRFTETQIMKLESDIEHC